MGFPPAAGNQDCTVSLAMKNNLIVWKSRVRKGSVLNGENPYETLQRCSGPRRRA